MRLRPLASLMLLAALACSPGAAAQEPPPQATPPITEPEPQATPPGDPSAGLRATERIARRYGAKRARLRFVISMGGIPDEVGTDRWVALAESQGARWGLRPDGVTFDSVSVRNGRTEVGFSDRVPTGALGVTYVRYRVRYRRLVRCRAAPDGSRSGCTTVAVKRLGTVVTDRDILIRRKLLWDTGPGWPESDEYDLQTVLIHEFGHLAGNIRHGSRCDPAPMMASLAPGDWWRSTLDHRVVCRRGAQAATAGGRTFGFAHRRLVERSYETRVVVDAAPGAMRPSDQ